MKQLFILFFLFLSQSCSHVFYQPSPKHFVDPAKFKLAYDDIFFESGDGTKLHGWFFKAKTARPKGTIVQFHGNAQNISTHFFSLIWVLDHGYNLFTFDYRGYAKSEGKPSQAGIYLDALAAFDKGFDLHKKHGGGNFVIYGQSTGGAISLRAIPDWNKKEEITLIVMDSAFASYQDIAFDKLTSRWFLYPISPLAFLLISDEYAADEVFEKITRPTLVIVGKHDVVVPPKFGKKIFKEIKAEKKWLWKVSRGSHIDVYHHSEGTSFREKFISLLDQLDR
ncbi:MAG: alpha/beta hydrolase [Bacteriovoracia bacterium]